MYKLKLWNKKYGKGAQFVVEKDGKFTVFTPDRPSDTVWVNSDLTKEAEYKNWDSFEDEPVESLDDIIM